MKLCGVSAFLTTALALVASSNAAVVLESSRRIEVDRPYVASNAREDHTYEAISRATLFFVDAVPVLLWDRASPDPAPEEAHVLRGIPPGTPAAAYATYDRAGHNTTGWGRLWVTTTHNVKMIDSMYAVGYLEGALNHDTIFNNYHNMRWDWFKDQPPTKTLLEWIDKNIDWTRRKARDHFTYEGDERLFWGGIAMSLAQFDGLVAGYNAHCPPQHRLEPSELMLLSADGDLETLVLVFPDDSGRNQEPRSRCSALVKVLDDKSDIYVGHATWDHYSLMLRTLKTYNITLPHSPTGPVAENDVFLGIAQHEAENSNAILKGYNRSITMSSSPGFLWSLDDFYITSNGLVVTETTNPDKTWTAEEGLHVNSVLSWMRGMAALWIAETPEQWTRIFSMYNSGTYNCQWMILDAKRFKKGEPLPTGSFYVLEQAANFFEVMDATDHLNENGYWASYNVPYFHSVWKASGFEKEYEKNPSDDLTFDHCPRANIFRELQPTVKDMYSMRKIMRNNDWQNNPLSKGNPGNAIAGRSDLATNPEEFQLDGAIDAKIVNMDMARRMVFDAVNGPTHDNQPVFDWRFHSADAHFGMPDRYDFDWVQYGAHRPDYIPDPK